jgi:predicted DNA-binding transcriptional regulator AlpA
MKFLKLKDLLKRYNIQRPALWRWRKNLGFPGSITPENTRPIWRLVDVENWEKQNSKGIKQN